MAHLLLVLHRFLQILLHRRHRRARVAGPLHGHVRFLIQVVMILLRAVSVGAGFGLQLLYVIVDILILFDLLESSLGGQERHIPFLLVLVLLNQAPQMVLSLLTVAQENVLPGRLPLLHLGIFFPILVRQKLTLLGQLLLELLLLTLHVRTLLDIFADLRPLKRGRGAVVLLKSLQISVIQIGPVLAPLRDPIESLR